jgi:hypothetical protein
MIILSDTVSLYVKETELVSLEPSHRSHTSSFFTACLLIVSHSNHSPHLQLIFSPLSTCPHQVILGLKVKMRKNVFDKFWTTRSNETHRVMRWTGPMQATCGGSN